MDAVEALERIGGAARWGRLDGRVPRRDLDRAVRDGLVLRPVRGLYHLPGCRPDVLAAVAVNGVRSCHSAAVAYGLDLIDPPLKPHVTAPKGSSTTWRPAVVHHRDARELEGCTDLQTTLLDCLTCLERRFALVPVDSALRLGRLSADDLEEMIDRLPRNDRRRKLLEMADPECGSPLETVGRVDLLDAGFSLQTQEIVLPVGRVDFVIDGWLVVELDGFETHAGIGPFVEDRRRSAELTRLGLVCLRFTFEQVVRNREWFLSVVRDTLRAGRPTARRAG